MDRGAWWATVYVVAKVRHNLATEPQPGSDYYLYVCSSMLLVSVNKVDKHIPLEEKVTSFKLF